MDASPHVDANASPNRYADSRSDPYASRYADSRSDPYANSYTDARPAYLYARAANSPVTHMGEREILGFIASPEVGSAGFPKSPQDKSDRRKL